MAFTQGQALTVRICLVAMVGAAKWCTHQWSSIASSCSYRCCYSSWCYWSFSYSSSTSSYWSWWYWSSTSYSSSRHWRCNGSSLKSLDVVEDLHALEELCCSVACRAKSCALEPWIDRRSGHWNTCEDYTWGLYCIHERLKKTDRSNYKNYNYTKNKIADKNTTQLYLTGVALGWIGRRKFPSTHALGVRDACDWYTWWTWRTWRTWRTCYGS